MDDELIEAGRKYIEKGESVRDAAVFAVDDFHGFTMEWSGDPKAHEAEYAALEEVLLTSPVCDSCDGSGFIENHALNCPDCNPVEDTSGGSDTSLGIPRDPQTPDKGDLDPGRPVQPHRSGGGQYVGPTPSEKEQ